jgi:hypothetical protein
VVAKIALPILENELGVVNTLYRAHEEEFANEVNGYKKGGTVRIRRPADFVLRKGATVSNQDVIEGYTTLTVDQQVGVDFQFTTSDLTLKETDLAERVIRPAMSVIANGMAQDVFQQMYLGTADWVGTAGQTINSFADFALGPQRMTENAIPMDQRSACLSPADNWGLIGSQTALLNNNLVGSAYTDGSLGRVGGLATYETQVLPTHTNGTATTASAVVSGNSQQVTYDNAKNSWTSTLVTKGWDASGTITAGTVITIANVYAVNPKTKAKLPFLKQFVVTADVTANATTSSATNLTISPPLISAAGPYQNCTYSGNLDGQAIAMVGAASGAYQQNLLYHKNAMALAVVPMEMPQGAIGGSRRSYKGLSVRVQPYYDGANDISKWRLDLLYGRALIDNRLSVRLSGTG